MWSTSAAAVSLPLRWHVTHSGFALSVRARNAIHALPLRRSRVGWCVMRAACCCSLGLSMVTIGSHAVYAQRWLRYISQTFQEIFVLPSDIGLRLHIQADAPRYAALHTSAHLQSLACGASHVRAFRGGGQNLGRPEALCDGAGSPADLGG